MATVALLVFRARVSACAFEVLHGSLVFLRSGEGRKRPEILALAGLGVLLARIQAKFSGFEFANHETEMRFLRRSLAANHGAGYRVHPSKTIYTMNDFGAWRRATDHRL